MNGHSMGRRDFLKTTAAAAIMAGVGGQVPGASAQEAAGPKKALQFGMLPKDLSDADKFKLAKACGFDGIETGPISDLSAAKKLGETAKAAGVTIHSVCFGGWDTAFSASDPAVIDRGLKAMEGAMRGAAAMGADAVLLVPAIVDDKTSYDAAYKRSQENVRKLLPLAQEVKVVIAVENVWNKFLLSPLEFARYVDEFESPWLRAYFDVGNVVIFGYPEQWIRILGKRIAKVHLKDFKRTGYEWKNLREGDVNWPEVRRAFAEVGYTGFLTTELGAGDEKYLRDLSQRIDLILAGK
jgi:hexulose-6-phosphate isomerase